MNDTRTTPTAGILAAFAIGALAGAGFALLYAPCSGEETRRIISTRSRELTRRAGDAFNDAKETIRGKRQQFTTAMQAGRDAVREELAK